MDYWLNKYFNQNFSGFTKIMQAKLRWYGEKGDVFELQGEYGDVLCFRFLCFIGDNDSAII